MKKLVLLLIVLVLMAAAYFFGRMNASKVVSAPPASWAEDNLSATAWRELVVSLEAAGATVFSATENSQDRLEGLQQLANLLSVSLEMKVSKSNAAAPKFTNWMSGYRKILGDSPDAIYHTAEISSDFRYEVTGNVGDTDYLGFMLYGTGLNGWNRAAANLGNDALNTDENGNFKIVLSTDKPAGSDVNWLALEDDIHLIMVRQYFHDRPNSAEATLLIRNLDPIDFEYPDDKTLASNIQNATEFFNSTLSGVVALTQMISADPNSAEPPKGYNEDFAGIFYPTHDNEYLGTWFKVAEDEALIIEGEVPNAPYWSASLQNRWLQSLDYEHHQVSLNDTQIKTSEDRFRIVLSHRKPEHENWLSAAGHEEGLLAIRYQQPRSDTTPPTLTLVKFEDL
ncbi:MAG: DUF1214 domain-containing protein [Pseudomonadales bacterium]